MSERLAYIEKIGEVLQKIVNPPQYSENTQKWMEALQVLKEMNTIARDIAMHDIALKSIATALEELNEKIKVAVAVGALGIIAGLMAIIIALLAG